MNGPGTLYVVAWIYLRLNNSQTSLIIWNERKVTIKLVQRNFSQKNTFDHCYIEPGICSALPCGLFSTSYIFCKKFQSQSCCKMFICFSVHSGSTFIWFFYLILVFCGAYSIPFFTFTFSGIPLQLPKFLGETWMQLLWIQKKLEKIAFNI